MINKEQISYLFPNFLKDFTEFYEAQKFWLRLCREILEKNKQEKNWIICGELLQHELGVLDSFEIVGGINFDRTKGIGIAQLDSEEYADQKIICYTVESDKFSDLKPAIYLEFRCVLSEESAEVFRKLLEKWIQPDCNREEIEKFIEESIEG